MEKKTIKISVTEGNRGRRLDKFLAESLPDRFSRASIQKLIVSGDVTVNGAPGKNNYRMRSGDMIEVRVPTASPPSLEGEDIPLDIVYEDKYLLVVNKPAGMVVHPAPGNWTGTLANALVAHCKGLPASGDALRPGIVHRLDKGTSGLLVVAKNEAVHRSLAKQFKNKTTRRVYVALVKGVVELDNGVIDLPVGRSAHDRKKMAVRFEETSKDARTSYRVLRRFKYFTLLELILGTGRTHQIRVHMAYIDHPVLGDAQYGTRGDLSRPALHAKMLGFVHPVTKKYMEFSSDLPDDIAGVIEKETKKKV
ncbi:MAG: RluA family pseudouridine synthase [Candidatus Omnitrophota bacterium]